MMLYHGTAEKNLPSIMAKGLVPRGGPGADQWAQIYDPVLAKGLAKANEKRPERLHSVYLAPSAARAYDFAELAAKVTGSKTVVLAVNLPPDAPVKRDSQAENGSGMLYLGTIPPADLAPMDIAVSDPELIGREPYGDVATRHAPLDILSAMLRRLDDHD